MGWASKSNGELLRLAEQEFEIFLTADQKLLNQQNLPTFRIAVLVLAAVSNRLRDIEPLLPRALEILAELQPAAFLLCPQRLDTNYPNRPDPEAIYQAAAHHPARPCGPNEVRLFVGREMGGVTAIAASGPAGRYNFPARARAQRSERFAAG